MSKVIQHVRGNMLDWFNYNPVLSNGELGIESDTNRIKVGNGIDGWNNLTYITDKHFSFLLQY